jgi:large subunit ribosomal protein L15
MNLDNLKPAKGATSDRKRIGRGQASGQGCTAGKGNKGAKVRSGYSSKPWFEGGQMPLQRRVPKRGFTNVHAHTVENVNVDQLIGLGSEKITAEVLKSHGLIRNANSRVKILGTGELGEPVNVRVHGVTASARQKIEAAGGKVDLIPKPRRYKKMSKKSERKK